MSTSNNAINIDLGLNTRQRFSIDGDPDRIIYLDTKDFGIADRFAHAVDRMVELEAKWLKLGESAQKAQDYAADVQVDDIHDLSDFDYTSIQDFSKDYRAVESEMRDILDEIFDCPGMCNVMLGKTSAFSVTGGRYKYEQIVDVLIKLYEKDIKAEVGQLNKRRIEQKTQKYIKK